MVIESDASRGRPIENSTGFCQIGRALMANLGPTSEEFVEHIQACQPCVDALAREQTAMNRQTNAAKRKGEI